eukprot:1231166-Rhodomonas_salina.1
MVLIRADVVFNNELPVDACADGGRASRQPSRSLQLRVQALSSTSSSTTHSCAYQLEVRETMEMIEVM